MSGKARILPIPKKYNPVTEVVNGVKVVKFPKEEESKTETTKTAK